MLSCFARVDSGESEAPLIRHLHAAGGFMSDYLAKHAGMRGRVWWMWACLATGAAFCIGLGVSQDSFPQTMVMVAFFAFFTQAGDLIPLR